MEKLHGMACVWLEGVPDDRSEPLLPGCSLAQEGCAVGGTAFPGSLDPLPGSLEPLLQSRR